MKRTLPTYKATLAYVTQDPNDPENTVLANKPGQNTKLIVLLFSTTKTCPTTVDVADLQGITVRSFLPEDLVLAQLARDMVTDLAGKMRKQILDDIIAEVRRWNS